MQAGVGGWAPESLNKTEAPVASQFARLPVYGLRAEKSAYPVCDNADTQFFMTAKKGVASGAGAPAQCTMIAPEYETPGKNRAARKR